MTLKAQGRAGKTGPFLAILAILSLAALPLPAQELAPQAAAPKAEENKGFFAKLFGR